MSEITLRGFSMEDPAYLAQWYRDDREGIEAIMGIELPSELQSTMAFNTILEKQQHETAIFRMAYRENEPIGFAFVTHISPEDRSGLASYYVAKEKRRYSLDVFRESEREAKRLGFRGFLVAIDQSNGRSLKIAKRLGYKEVKRVMLVKEFA
jgi:RimJ/RimL family protein N-acetyltransferase